MKSKAGRGSLAATNEVYHAERRRRGSARKDGVRKSGKRYMSSLVESYARGLLLFLCRLGSLGQFSVARVFRFRRVPGTWTSPGYVDCVERPPEIYLTRRERPPSSSVRESMLDGLWRDMALDVAVVIFRAIDESVRPGYGGRSRASDVHVVRCACER